MIVEAAGCPTDVVQRSTPTHIAPSGEVFPKGRLRTYGLIVAPSVFTCFQRCVASPRLLSCEEAKSLETDGVREGEA
jgi:hypothetical protein